MTSFGNIVFSNKRDAINKKKDTQIIATFTLQKYFCIDSHTDLLEYILASPSKYFYEYIPKNTPINMFFDVEIYKHNDITDTNTNTDQNYFDNPLKIIAIIKDSINSIQLLKEYNKKWVILESHNQEKRSFHIIIRLTDKQGNEWYFKDFTEIKLIHDLFNFKNYKSGKGSYIIDPSVYKDGLFRTIYSSKEGEDRPLVKSESITDEFHDIDSFVTFTRNTINIIPKINAKIKKDITESAQVLESELDNTTENLLKETIGLLYNADTQLLGKPFLDSKNKCIIVPSLIKWCPFIKREHKSNHSYFVIDYYSIKQKCHDSDCDNKKHSERTINSLDKTLLMKLGNYLEISSENISKIDSAIQDATSFLTKYDSGIQNVTYNQVYNTFFTLASENCLLNLRGHCHVCNAAHVITRNGYCLECVNCKSRVPEDGYLPVEIKVNAFFTQIFIQNNITIVNGEDNFTNTDIVLDPGIFNDDPFTNLLCNALHGNKKGKLGDVFFTLNKNFAYSDKIWYMFDGQFWKEDPEGCNIKHTIMNVLTECLNKVIIFYKDKTDSENLVKSINKLIINLNEPKTLSEIEKMMRLEFYDIWHEENKDKYSFKSLLNSKIYLVPFTNGVYDLKQKKFRVIEKDDYVQKHLDYDYDPLVSTDTVLEFISKILPNHKVRDYFLASLAKCLNGEESNEYFHILCGSGSNGKSQIINLIIETLGKFTYKPDISLITKDRSDSSSATPQKAGLYNVRFAYFSEPNRNDSFNAALLKEITGNEDITARNLYENTMTFKIHSKFYLACNQIPKIDGDPGVWRRIRVIDFNSKFVDEPTKPNEYKKDYSIPQRLKDDPAFKKGFMNLLLKYYPVDIKCPPPEVTESTRQYIDRNEFVNNWLDANIFEQKDNILKIPEIYEAFIADTEETSFRKSWRSLVTEYFILKYNTIERYHRVGNKRIQSFKGFNIREF
jgi:P4 family phage/plasmid primase-like protien